MPGRIQLDAALEVRVVGLRWQVVLAVKICEQQWGLGLCLHWAGAAGVSDFAGQRFVGYQSGKMVLDYPCLGLSGLVSQSLTQIH